MHIDAFLTGAPPRTSLVKLTALPRPSRWIKRPSLKGIGEELASKVMVEKKWVSGEQESFSLWSC